MVTGGLGGNSTSGRPPFTPASPDRVVRAVAPGHLREDGRMAPDRNPAPRKEQAPASRVGGNHLHLALPRGAQLLATAFLAMAAILVPWTVFLGLSLPPRYDAGHWNLLWTGFDVGLIVVLGYAGWAAWFHRQVLATTAIVAGTLLLCDAWFDIVTSIGRPDQWVTLLTGFGVEVPLAVFFLWLYRHIVLGTLAALYRLAGDEPPPGRLRHAHVMVLPTRPPKARPGARASEDG
jgi:hypothetical protein